MKVSIVIPCYNVEDYIEECILSVLSQKYSDIEIFCVDDGSKDDTVLKIKNLQKNYGDKIRLIEQTNRGASAARNTGLKYANGEFIQFLDADDLLLPGKIENQINLIENCDQKPALVVGDYIRKYHTGFETEVRADRRSYWYGILGIRLGITSSNLWEKNVLDRVKGWDETLISSQEYDLIFRILKTEPYVVYDNSLTTIVRRRETNSIHRTNMKENRIIAIGLRQNIFDYLVREEKLNPDLEEYYYESTFKVIQTLFKFDKEEALKWYKRELPKNFIPRDTSLNKKWYITLYKIMGFKNAQIVWCHYINMKSILRNILKNSK